MKTKKRRLHLARTGSGLDFTPLAWGQAIDFPANAVNSRPDPVFRRKVDGLTPRSRIPAVIIGKLLIFIIRVYRLIVSPLLGNCCRFYPSCSAYCIMAIEKYGCMKGVWFGILRICKCHPFHSGGVDLV